MVDYDTAVAAVQNPNADPVFLAKIAYENPEFGANVAVNPRCYPGLKRWIAEFGDARARQTLEQMGIVAQAGPVVDQPASAGNPAPSAEPQPTVEQQPAATYQYDGGHLEQPATSYRQYPYQQADNTHDVQYDPARNGAQQPAAPVASNPYGFTVEQALDPHTDQMTIAQIAQYAPELRPCIARNPNTYPALLGWLAQLHDPQIDAALAARR